MPKLLIAVSAALLLAAPTLLLLLLRRRRRGAVSYPLALFDSSRGKSLPTMIRRFSRLYGDAALDLAAAALLALWIAGYPTPRAAVAVDASWSMLRAYRPGRAGSAPSAPLYRALGVAAQKYPDRELFLLVEDRRGAGAIRTIELGLAGTALDAEHARILEKGLESAGGWLDYRDRDGGLFELRRRNYGELTLLTDRFPYEPDGFTVEELGTGPLSGQDDPPLRRPATAVLPTEKDGAWSVVMADGVPLEGLDFRFSFPVGPARPALRDPFSVALSGAFPFVEARLGGGDADGPIVIATERDAERAVIAPRLTLGRPVIAGWPATSGAAGPRAVPAGPAARANPDLALAFWALLAERLGAPWNGDPRGADAAEAGRSPSIRRGSSESPGPAGPTPQAALPPSEYAPVAYGALLVLPPPTPRRWVFALLAAACYLAKGIAGIAGRSRPRRGN